MLSSNAQYQRAYRILKSFLALNLSKSGRQWLDKNSPSIMAKKAWDDVANKNCAEAKIVFENLVKLQEENYQAHYGLAYCYYFEGAYHKSRAQLRYLDDINLMTKESQRLLNFVEQKVVAQKAKVSEAKPKKIFAKKQDKLAIQEAQIVSNSDFIESNRVKLYFSATTDLAYQNSELIFLGQKKLFQS